MLDLKKIKKIFFIGIGGIGISAVARILKKEGKDVLGSDATASEITEQIIQEGIKVFIGQKAENITADIDLAVYSVAVPLDNLERKAAKKLGIGQISYPELLGLLMKDKYGVGVSGTDGKTTTTAMLGKIFFDAGLEPTIVLGSKAGYLGGNSCVGKSNYFIFESDEYRRAFINYFPKIAIITNIKADHLDYFRGLEDIKSAFSAYLSHLPEDGYAIINSDDKNAVEISKSIPAKIIFFGINNRAEVMAKNIKISKIAPPYQGGAEPSTFEKSEGRERVLSDDKQEQERMFQVFNIFYKSKKLGKIALPLPARYNIYNALAAVSAALVLKIDFAIISKSLAGFQGVWRRFEKLGRLGNAEIITDYAHTPYAVSQTIQAVKEFYPNKKILSVFQPHQYARTKNLFEEFVSSFNEADQVIISDIFYVSGRENPADFSAHRQRRSRRRQAKRQAGVSGGDVSPEKLTQKLVEAAKRQGARVEYGGDLKKTEKLIRERLAEFDAALLMGAGDIYGLAKKLSARGGLTPKGGQAPS